jgi:hypothetical protein
MDQRLHARRERRAFSSGLATATTSSIEDVTYDASGGGTIDV